MFARLAVGRKLVFNKNCHILHTVHALTVRPLAYHRELAAGNLAEQIVHITTVLLLKDYGRTDYNGTLCRGYKKCDKITISLHSGHKQQYFFLRC